jgi:hypothetical protein
MAYGAGGNLNDGGAGSFEALGIVIGGEVADYDSSFEMLLQRFNGFLDKCRFAGAGGGKDVQDEQAVGGKETAVAFGQAIVLLENRLADFYHAALGGSGKVLVRMLRLGMRMGVSVGMGMGMRVRVSVAVPGFMIVVVAMFMIMLVRVHMFMFVFMLMDPLDVRFARRQSASTFLAHYSISNEAISNSRPARISELGPWQSGHSGK